MQQCDKFIQECLYDDIDVLNDVSIYINIVYLQVFLYFYRYGLKLFQINFYFFDMYFFQLMIFVYGFFFELNM